MSSTVTAGMVDASCAGVARATISREPVRRPSRRQAGRRGGARSRGGPRGRIGGGPYPSAQTADRPQPHRGARRSPLSPIPVPAPIPARPTPSRSSSRASGGPCAGPWRPTPAPARCTARTPRTTGCCPAAVVAPRDRDDLAEVVALAAEAGVPLTMRGAGTSIAGNAIGPGLVVDLSRHLAGVLALDPEAGPRPCCRARSSTTSTAPPRSTGCGSGRTRPRTAAAPSAGCSATTPAGRARSAGGPRRRTRWGWRSSPRTGPGGGPGRSGRRSTRAIARARSTTHGDTIRRELPPWPRRVSGLRPGLAAARARRGRRPGARRQRGDLRRGLRGDAPARPAAGRARPARPRVRRRHRRRGGRPGPPARAAVHRREPDRGAAHRLARSGPAAAGRRVAAGRGRRGDRGRAAGPCRAPGRGRRDPRGRPGRLPARGRGRPGRSCGGSARTARDARRACPDGSPAWPGLRGRGRAAGTPGRVPRRAPGAAPRPRPAGRHVRPLRRGLHPPAGRLRAGPAGRRGTAGRVHGRGRGPRGGPRRLAVRGARRRPGPRRAAGPPVLAGDAGRVPGLEGRLGPGQRAQPRDPRGPAAADRRTCAGRARRSWPWSRRSPTRPTAATCARPSSGASGWGSASRASPARRCAPATGPPARSATPRGAGRGCSRRWPPAPWRPTAGARPRSATRSTCASPAAPASRTARPAWTWPPTRPSSSTTTTAGGCGPRSHYSLGRLPSWLRLVRRIPAGPRLANAVMGFAPTRRAFGLVAGIAGERRIPRIAARTFAATAAPPAPAGRRGHPARPGHRLAGHLHQPPRARGGPRGAAGARGGRVRGGGPAHAGLLRPHGDHHRPAGPRPGRAAPHARRPGAGGRRAGPGAGALVRRPRCATTCASCCRATRRRPR